MNTQQFLAKGNTVVALIGMRAMGPAGDYLERF